MADAARRVSIARNSDRFIPKNPPPHALGRVRRHD
jgi:hypothetical protein